MYLICILWACSETHSDTEKIEESIDTGLEESEQIPEEPEEPEEPGTPDNPDIDHMIDATDSMEWVYFDLESSSIVSVQEAESSEEWDIGFQRYSIMLNGGVSGDGGVELLILEGEYDNFDMVKVPSQGDWVTDTEDNNGDEKPEYAFSSWFDYDSSTHVLSPADVVYIIRSVEQNYFKIRIWDYYSTQGNSGFMSFELEEIELE